MNPRSPNILTQASQFIDLFGGFERIGQVGAFGTGKGEWVKRPLVLDDVVSHLTAVGPGIGIPPLCPDNKVSFAAIDLDEPDFDAAREMRTFIPGTSFIERSRSGNAHVWVFFREPLDAWVAMGILKEATFSAGKDGVEVFPKNHDFSTIRLGSYINLPYHGHNRAVVDYDPDRSSDWSGQWAEYTLDAFIKQANETRNDPKDWQGRAQWMQLDPPDRAARKKEFGTAPYLHMCAEHIIANRDDNPVVEGHRNAVFFALAKMLSNCSLFDHDEALELMRLVNEAAIDRTPDREIRRILTNAERGQWTSTGCDDPLLVGYTHPDCPIANRRANEADTPGQA